jgi:hypothetical protein
MIKCDQTVCAQCEKIVEKDNCNTIAYIEQYGFKSLICDWCAGYNEWVDHE